MGLFSQVGVFISTERIAYVMEKLMKLRISMALLIMMAAAPLFSLNVQAKKPIYTNNAEIDAAVEIILDRCTSPEMTKKEKLREAYVYLVNHMHYTHSRGSVKIHVSKKKKREVRQETKALKKERKTHFSSKFRSRYRHVLTMSGTCYDMSAVFCIVANHIGYDAGLCSGRYVRSNGSSCEHWWNYVRIDGEKRYFDVQAANAMKGKKFSYYCKRGSSRTWRKHHSS